jgi:hypothetical protein
MILKISDFSPLLQTMLAAKNKMRRDSLHTCKSFCYWVRILVDVLVFLPEGHRIIICHEKKTIHKEPREFLSILDLLHLLFSFLGIHHFVLMMEDRDRNILQ